MGPSPADPEGSPGVVEGAFSGKVRFFFLMVSIYGMLMLVMIPCWNCLVLLQSWVFAQLIGAQAPLTFLLLLLGLVCLFIGMLMFFFHSTKVEAQTFQTIVMMGSAILTLLGVVFMLFGHEVAELARSAQKDVEHNCPFAKATQPLYVESKMLYALRFQEECASMTSVEQCQGYRPSAPAQVLKNLEINFKCSTFCTEVEPPDEDFPVTLFSRANYRPSCQMVLVRNLRYYVEDMGMQAYFQGCMLVLTSAAIGFLKLLGFCAPQRRLFGKAPPAQAPQAGDGGQYGAARYVDSRGILR